jgi:site-specific DNA-methyltransferase (adenine-specific)
MTAIGNGQFHVGDCLDVMSGIPDASVDMVLCDLPYGTTQNKWDSVIPFVPLWDAYWRVAKPNAAIVLTAQTPFDKALGASQIQHLKYEWVWRKEAGTGFLNAKKQPLKNCENVLVFYREQSLYNPQMRTGFKPYRTVKGGETSNYNTSGIVTTENNGDRYPTTLLEFPRDKDKTHPTQKPVALFEYLIRTYTNEGDTVLDNCAGSGTTAIAAENAKRRWICVERDEGYATKAVARIRKHVGEVDIFG